MDRGKHLRKVERGTRVQPRTESGGEVIDASAKGAFGEVKVRSQHAGLYLIALVAIIFLGLIGWVAVNKL